MRYQVVRPPCHRWYSRRPTFSALGTCPGLSKLLAMAPATGAAGEYRQMATLGQCRGLSIRIRVSGPRSRAARGLDDKRQRRTVSRHPDPTPARRCRPLGTTSRNCRPEESGYACQLPCPLACGIVVYVREMARLKTTGRSAREPLGFPSSAQAPRGARQRRYRKCWPRVRRPDMRSIRAACRRANYRK